MAVVQISRIQVRRGKANSGTGLPQLASGEMAWAVDTQQLFIGNGAVSEGSPAVGNTRLLTENDLSSYSNLITLLQYTYQVNNSAMITGPGANNPIQRTFQQRLDDQVTAADFGTVGNGANDDTAALQRAVNQLFLNPSQPSYTSNSSYATGTPSATATRVTLTIPPGIYFTSSTIYVPSYSTLIGSGADKTIIYYNSVVAFPGSATSTSATIVMPAATADMLGATISGTGVVAGSTIILVNPGQSVVINNIAVSTTTNATYTIGKTGPAVQLVNDSSTIGNPSPISSTLGTTQPRNVEIKGLTIRSVSGVNSCLQLDSARDSIFTDLILQGDWQNSLSSNCNGIILNATGSLVTCDHNIFRNIRFNSFSYGIFSKYDITNNIFEDCYFNDAYQAIVLGLGTNGVTDGQLYGPRQTQVRNCKFNNIRQQAMYISKGYGNTIVNSKLTNVGCNGAGNTQAVYPQMYFASFGNSTVNDWSDRADSLMTTNLTTAYIPEFSGHGMYTSHGTRQLVIGYAINPMFFFRLPVSMTQNGIPTGSINYTINYCYQSTTNNFSRRGIITISANITAVKVQLSDEFDFAGSDSGNSVAQLLDFSVKFLDQTGNAYVGSVGQTPSSIAIYYSNNYTNDAGYFNFNYTANL